MRLSTYRLPKLSISIRVYIGSHTRLYNFHSIENRTRNVGN